MELREQISWMVQPPCAFTVRGSVDQIWGIRGKSAKIKYSNVYLRVIL
jgi:hypothetical protein